MKKLILLLPIFLLFTANTLSSQCTISSNGLSGTFSSSTIFGKPINSICGTTFQACQSGQITSISFVSFHSTVGGVIHNLRLGAGVNPPVATLATPVYQTFPIPAGGGSQVITINLTVPFPVVSGNIYQFEIENIGGIFDIEGQAGSTIPNSQIYGELGFGFLTAPFEFDFEVQIDPPVSPTISLVDANGDGTPDITDPCSCSDMMNITDGANITYFHDFIQIASGPGETWEITAYNSGGLHFSNGVLMPVGTVIPEITPGVYYLDVWHPDATGFDADFDRTAGGVAFPLNTSNSCNNSDCANVPTLSTWGLICMCLFLMSFGSIVLMKQSELSVANQSTSFSASSIFQNPPLDRSILTKAVFATLILSILAGVITFAVYGSIAMVDIIGFMVAGPLFAYLMHLMMMQLNKK